MRAWVSSLAVLILAGPSRAEDAAARPKPVPVTRPEVKQAVDALKKAKPRLPLEPLTKDEIQKSNQMVVNNGRMRAKYLPEEFRAAFMRDPDAKMTFDRKFRVMLFWIVSRVNNCHYCLGHQEIGLKTLGVPDDTIAALDFDWSEFTPAERAAFGFARKLAYEPHSVGTGDLGKLRKHYTEDQTLEIVLMVAGFASTNRWTDSLGIPQEEDFSLLKGNDGNVLGRDRKFLTATSDKYQERPSLVAAIAERNKNGPGATALIAPRPALEAPAEVAKALEASRQRTPAFKLVTEADAQALLPADWPRTPLPQWVRLLANFPKHGIGRALGLRAAEEKGRLDKRLYVQIAWVCARHDRAWYALGTAQERLTSLGMKDNAILALQGPLDKFSPAEAAALAFARKLTVAPQAIVDQDIASLRKHFSDHQVAEIVNAVCNAAFFDRITEAAGLQLEK